MCIPTLIHSSIFAVTFIYLSINDLSYCPVEFNRLYISIQVTNNKQYFTHFSSPLLLFLQQLVPLIHSVFIFSILISHWQDIKEEYQTSHFLVILSNVLVVVSAISFLLNLEKSSFHKTLVRIKNSNEALYLKYT